MKKINDWFVAGLIAGITGGMGLIIFNLGLLLLGVPTGTYWQAVGGLFYNQELIKHWLAQIHGVIDALGVSGANGILLAFTIKKTGTDYLYPKSLVLSAVAAYFLFTAVYPQTGLSKDNPYTPWVALFGHTIFIGLLSGFVLQKIHSFDSQQNKETSAPQPGDETVTYRPGSLIATLYPTILPEPEYGENLFPVPEFSGGLIPAPDNMVGLPPVPRLIRKPGMKEIHFVKPKKLKGRTE